MTDLAEVFARLAAGGAVTASELAAVRSHMVATMVSPGAPVERYTCNAKLRDGSICDQELCASNAPYGVCHMRCSRCGQSRTVYFGGYRQASDGHLSAERGGANVESRAILT